MRDLLASPLGPNSGFAHDYVRFEDVPVVDAMPPPASSQSDPPLQQQPSSSLIKPAGVNGWLGLASTLFKGDTLFKGGETEEERLRKQMREYEQRLTDMRELAIRQARDITSLRTMAEQQIVQASEVGSARDEERWKRMLQDATQTQQQALIEGQRTMHELAASLQEAQRQAAQQQAHEWRAALLQASQEHAKVVEQLQAQLKSSEEKQLTLQAHLRDARRASAVAAAAAIANGKTGGVGGEALEQAVERAVNAEREAATARVSAAEEAAERRLDTERSAARASQAESACIQRQLTEKNRAMQTQLTEMKAQLEKATSQLEQQTAHVAELQVALRAARQASEAEVARVRAEERAEREKHVQIAEEAMKAAEARARHMAVRRREACNKLQEASGAIRVLCRARPLSATEIGKGESPVVSVPAYNLIALQAPPPPEGDGARVECAFDACFGSVCTTQQLYDEVSPAITSVLQGQYVCVMAYGQTGAGKSYTMQGAGSEPGLVHLACDELLREARLLEEEYARRAEPLEVFFTCSMLEVYNEKVLDLLHEKIFDGRGREVVADALEVRAAADGTVSVPHLTTLPFDSGEAVAEHLTAAGKRRHTHATLMNAASSRSHLVLTVHVTLRNTRDDTERTGKLHLVDLAGSERVGKSGVQGEQLREAQHINKSLSALELVMTSLHERSRKALGKEGGGGEEGGTKEGGGGVHIPYRNSKLTLLLSDALGAKGSCAKTIMIMQASPAACNAVESLRTLRFGERCQSVTLGAVKRGAGAGAKSGAKSTEAATARADAAEEKVTRVHTELLETRRQAKDADERAKQSEGRAGILADKVQALQAQLEAARQQTEQEKARVVAAKRESAMIMQASTAAAIASGVAPSRQTPRAALSAKMVAERAAARARAVNPDGCGAAPPAAALFSSASLSAALASFTPRGNFHSLQGAQLAGEVAVEEAEEVAAAVVDAAAEAVEEAAAAEAAAALLSPPPHAIRLSFGGRPDPARSHESQASAPSSAQGSAQGRAQGSAQGSAPRSAQGSAHGSAQSSNSSSRDRGSGGSSLGASGSRGSSRSNSTFANGAAADHLPDALRRSLQLPHMPNSHQLSCDGLGTDKENPTRMATGKDQISDQISDKENPARTAMGKAQAPASARETVRDTARETVRDTARELSRAQYNLRPKTARPLGGVAADSLAAAQLAPKRRPESARPAPSFVRTAQPAPSTVAATGGARWR